MPISVTGVAQVNTKQPAYKYLYKHPHFWGKSLWRHISPDLLGAQSIFYLLLCFRETYCCKKLLLIFLLKIKQCYLYIFMTGNGNLLDKLLIFKDNYTKHMSCDQIWVAKILNRLPIWVIINNFFLSIERIFT